MKVRQFVFSAAVAALASVNFTAAEGAIIIKTSDGMGADAEVRESETNTFVPGLGQPGSQFVRGSNRGNNQELATRVNDSVTVSSTDPAVVTTPFPTNDRSSIIYLKFDLSTLPASTHPMWSNSTVNLRLFARNNNQIQGSDLWSVIPGGDSMNVADYRLNSFGIKGLDPNATYNNGTDGRTDRMGNVYTANFNQYNWVEGTGNVDNVPTGITYYNAPGLRPHCIRPGEGACTDPNIAGSNDSEVQTLGLYDDFDPTQVVDIEDSWHWPNETEAAGYTGTAASPAGLPAGKALDYTDPNGNLLALLVDALAAAEAGGDPVMTLMVYVNLDGTVHQPLVGRNGTTPAAMLNQNYLTTPKEYLGPNVDNSTGMFNPQLIIVPEPATVSLVALGLVAAFGSFAGRRRRSRLAV